MVLGSNSWSGPEVKADIAWSLPRVCATFVWAYLAGGTASWSRGFAAGLVRTPLFQWSAKHLPLPQTTAHRGEGSLETPAWLRHVQRVVQVLSSATEPCCPFVESHVQSRQHPWFWENSYRTPLANPVPGWEAAFGDKGYLVGALSPQLFGDFV